MRMPQSSHSLKFWIHNKIVPLKSLLNSVRVYMIFKNKGNSRTFKHPDKISIVFQGFEGLEKSSDELLKVLSNTSMTCKVDYFQ